MVASVSFKRSSAASIADKLEKKLAEIEKETQNASKVNVGFLANATYAEENGGTNVATVAAIQEFGAPKAGIPPRPYFRTMIAKNKSEWGPKLGKILKRSRYNLRESLTLMGQEIAGDLRQSIVDVAEPPLSQVTLMLRKMKMEKNAGKYGHYLDGGVVTFRTVQAARRLVVELQAKGKSVSGAPTKPLVDTGHMLNSIDWEVK